MEETGNKTILVLRHAKSDWGVGLPDYERPLNERGRNSARLMGQQLAAYNIDLVWCSAARRTVETWALAQQGGASARQVDQRRGFYHTWVDDLVEEMRLLDETVATLLIINHMPTVGNLVVMLAAPSPLTERVAGFYPTAGLAVLTHAGAWGGVGRGSAVLQDFITPRTVSSERE